MPNTPCWADIAARDYAADPSEARQTAGYELEDLIGETWTVEKLHGKLKPHELETLDGIISAVAERMLEELEEAFRMDDSRAPVDDRA